MRRQRSLADDAAPFRAAPGVSVDARWGIGPPGSGAPVDKLFKFSPRKSTICGKLPRIRAADSRVCARFAVQISYNRYTAPHERGLTSIEDIVRRNVAALRSKANLTQQGLADEMLARGIAWTRETVAQVETTNRRLGFTEAIAVAACLDVPLARLTATGADRRRRRQRVDDALPGCGHGRDGRRHLPARQLRRARLEADPAGGATRAVEPLGRPVAGGRRAVGGAGVTIRDEPAGRGGTEPGGRAPSDPAEDGRADRAAAPAAGHRRRRRHRRPASLVAQPRERAGTPGERSTRPDRRLAQDHPWPRLPRPRPRARLRDGAERRRGDRTPGEPSP